ncbi:hypothetical protein PMAYCL1PPCAC_00869, partial [Pristionchus mayeri]
FYTLSRRSSRHCGPAKPDHPEYGAEVCTGDRLMDVTSRRQCNKPQDISLYGAISDCPKSPNHSTDKEQLDEPVEGGIDAVPEATIQEEEPLPPHRTRPEIVSS